MKLIMSPANKIILIVTAIALVALLVVRYWEPIKGFFLGVFNTIKSYLEMCGVDFEKLRDVIGKVKDAITLIIQGLINVFVWLWEKLQPILAMASEYIKIVCSVWQGAFEGFMTGVGSIVNGIVGILGGLIDFIVGVFTGSWATAWEGVKSVFSGIFEGILGIGKSVMNSLIGFINGGIRGLNNLTNITLPDFLGGKQIGFSIPEIPMLYKGTDNWKGGTAMIHDRGAEIVDLPKGSRVYPHDESIKKAFNDGKSSTTSGVNITISNMTVRKQSDIDEIANALYNKLKKQAFNMA